MNAAHRQRTPPRPRRAAPGRSSAPNVGTWCLCWAAAVLLAACGDGGHPPAEEPVAREQPPPPPPNQPPKISSFKVTPAEGTLPLTVVATMDVRNERDEPYGYSYDFGDGNVYHYDRRGAGANPYKSRLPHTYTTHGTHTVTVTARDERGAEATATAIVDANAPPVAHIVLTKDHDTPFKMDLSAAGSHDPDGTIVSYEWELSKLVGYAPRRHETIRLTGVEVSHINWLEGSGYISGYHVHFTDLGNGDGVSLTVTDDKGATGVAHADYDQSWRHSVAGLHGLIERVKAAGGPFGVLPLMNVANGCPLDIDDEPDGPYCSSVRSHPRYMRAITVREGVPEENILMQWHAYDPKATNFAIHDRHARARAEGMVVSEPTDPFPATRLGIEYLKRLNMVWVAAAGNNHNLALHYGCREPAPGFDNRDYWNVNHPVWDYCEDRDRDWQSNAYGAFHRIVATVETGRVLVAAAHGLRHDGTVVPLLSTNFCGDLMENCFTMRAPHTSGATATLGAVMYYFMHMYDDAAEAVVALKRCTRDVGEPGVDRENGQGVIDLRFCPEARLPILDPATRAARRGPNLPPIPDPGDDRTVKLGDAVTLDGSGSTDPERGTLLYRWEQGRDADDSRIFFDVFDRGGGVDHHTHVFTPIYKNGRRRFDEVEQRTLFFRLYVTDEGGLTASEVVRITVEYD